MKTEMKELELNEMEQVNGGIVWFIPIAGLAIAGAIAIYEGYKAVKEYRK